MPNCPDLIKAVERGRRKDLPELSLYGWALSALDHDPGEWDEEAIHVSDYKYALPPSEGGCDRQLWHRLRQDDRKEDPLQKLLMWDQGTAMQMRFTWLMSHGLPDGWEIEAVEADISDGLPYDHTGSCDLVLRGPSTIVNVEMKTVRGRAFHYLDGPKESARIQSQGELYAQVRRYPSMHVLQRTMYIDREGSNRPLVFPVRRDDERIERAAEHVEGVRKRLNETTPDTIAPKIEVSENKTTTNSIKLSQLWPCDYCEFRGESCPGALPDEALGHGIIARGDHTDVDSLEWKVNGDLRSTIEQGIARAVQAGNVKTK